MVKYHKSFFKLLSRSQIDNSLNFNLPIATIFLPRFIPVFSICNYLLFLSPLFLTPIFEFLHSHLSS